MCMYEYREIPGRHDFLHICIIFYPPFHNGRVKFPRKPESITSGRRSPPTDQVNDQRQLYSIITSSRRNEKYGKPHPAAVPTIRKNADQHPGLTYNTGRPGMRKIHMNRSHLNIPSKITPRDKNRDTSAQILKKSIACNPSPALRISPWSSGLSQNFST